MPEETSTPETGEALTTEGFAESLLTPARKPPTEPKAKEAAQDAEVVETEAEDETEDEVEAATDDVSDDDADEEDDEKDVEEDDDDEPLYTVKVDGVEKQVPIAELLKNYSLESASQKRMREAAEMRTALEGQQKQITAEQQQMREAFKARMAELAQPSEQEPNWLELAREDPLGYIERRAEWDAKQATRMQAAQQFQAMQAQEHHQRLTKGREALFDAIPEWRDNAKYVADTKEIGEAAASAYGFTEQELSSIADPRMVRTLRDAIAYRKLRDKRSETAKKVAKAPKVMKPGASQTKGEAKAEASRSVADKVKKTGSVNAFAEWMLQGKT